MRRADVEHAVAALAEADDVVRLERLLHVRQPLHTRHAVDGPRLGASQPRSGPLRALALLGRGAHLPEALADEGRVLHGHGEDQLRRRVQGELALLEVLLDHRRAPILAVLALARRDGVGRSHVVDVVRHRGDRQAVFVQLLHDLFLRPCSGEVFLLEELRERVAVPLLVSHVLVVLLVVPGGRSQLLLEARGEGGCEDDAEAQLLPGRLLGRLVLLHHAPFVHVLPRPRLLRLLRLLVIHEVHTQPLRGQGLQNRGHSAVHSVHLEHVVGVAVHQDDVRECRQRRHSTGREAAGAARGGSLQHLRRRPYVLLLAWGSAEQRGQDRHRRHCPRGARCRKQKG